MSRMYLPALRGFLGDWTYYSCLMPMGEIATRVSFAEDLHKNKRLSELIQRELEKTRAKQISRYLRTQKERFFNSLVIAVYGGDPAWHRVGGLTPLKRSIDPEDIPADVRDSLGLLSFSGEEKLFAVDGQHRLAGIKQAVREQESLKSEELSIVVIAHKNTPEGLERTRRLFTTLNKTAKPVVKGQIIALDEDDVMAICVRRLVESHPFFDGDRVAYTATNNLPKSNQTSLTTIGNLYDVLKILFKDVMGAKIQDLMFNRPEVAKLDEYYDIACTYFDFLGMHFPDIAEFFDALNPSNMVQLHRLATPGSVLYRPIGLTVFTEVIASISDLDSLEEGVQLASKLPQGLNEVPFTGVIWNESREKMIPQGRALARDLLRFMLGRYDKGSKQLGARYGKALEQPNAGDKLLSELPRVTF